MVSEIKRTAIENLMSIKQDYEEIKRQYQEIIRNVPLEDVVEYDVLFNYLLFIKED